MHGKDNGGGKKKDCIKMLARTSSYVVRFKVKTFNHSTIALANSRTCLSHVMFHPRIPPKEPDLFQQCDKQS